MWGAVGAVILIVAATIVTFTDGECLLAQYSLHTLHTLLPLHTGSLLTVSLYLLTGCRDVAGKGGDVGIALQLWVLFDCGCVCCLRAHCASERAAMVRIRPHHPPSSQHARVLPPVTFTLLTIAAQALFGVVSEEGVTVTLEGFRHGSASAPAAGQDLQQVPWY